jgi:hypothetical protein
MSGIDSAASSTATIDKSESSTEDGEENLDQELTEEELAEAEADAEGAEVDAEAAAAEAAKAEEEEADPEVKLTRNAQRRYDALSSKLREKDRQIAELQGGQVVNVEDLGPPPNRDDFDDDIEFASAEGAYKGALKVFTTLRQNQDTAAQSEGVARTAEKLNSHTERVGKARESIADYDEVVAGSKLEVLDGTRNLLPVASAILGLDNSPQVSYYIAANPDIAEQLNRASGEDVGVMVGRLSEQLKASPVKLKPKPKPIESEDTGAGLGKADDGLEHIKGAKFS